MYNAYYIILYNFVLFYHFYLCNIQTVFIPVCVTVILYLYADCKRPCGPDIANKCFYLCHLIASHSLLLVFHCNHVSQFEEIMCPEYTTFGVMNHATLLAYCGCVNTVNQSCLLCDCVT